MTTQIAYSVNERVTNNNNNLNPLILNHSNNSNAGLIPETSNYYSNYTQNDFIEFLRIKEYNKAIQSQHYSQNASNNFQQHYTEELPTNTEQRIQYMNEMYQPTLIKRKRRQIRYEDEENEGIDWGGNIKAFGENMNMVSNILKDKEVMNTVEAVGGENVGYIAKMISGGIKDMLKLGVTTTTTALPLGLAAPIINLVASKSIDMLPI